MVAKLTVTPNPAPAGSVVAVAGTGLVQSRLTRVLLDGAVQATDFRSPKGAFAVGILVSKTAKSSTVEVEQKQPGGSWSVVARLAPLLTFLPPSGADVTAPVITATAQAINITSVSFTVSWTTNEPSTSVVNYGLTAAYGSTTTQTPLVTTHTVPITGLTASTLYHFRVQSVDAAGNTVVSGDATQTTFAGGVTDTTAPVISSIVATPNANGTQCTISWSLDEYATGQVIYSLSPAMTSPQYSVKETSFAYNAHVQTISSLTANTTYYYQVQSGDASGNIATSAVQSFITTATIATYLTGVYGAGHGNDGKNNKRVGSGLDATIVSYRFIATQNSAPTSISSNERWGGGYSAGTGGLRKIAIQADSGGVPSGTDLTSVQYAPVDPTPFTESKAYHSFSGAPALVKGNTYHVCFTNPDSASGSNYVSVNMSFDANPRTTPTRQPAFTDDFAALLYNGSWATDSNDVPVFDLVYANGNHDGNSYFGTYTINGYQIAGTSFMVRERFTVTGGTRSFTSIGCRIMRISGAGALTIRVEDSGGSSLYSTTIAAANWSAAAALPRDPPTGSVWNSASLSGTIVNGTTYNVRLSCPAGSVYYALGSSWQDVNDPFTPEWSSYGFRDGTGQYTTDGTNWLNMSASNPTDLGFYLA